MDLEMSEDILSGVEKICAYVGQSKKSFNDLRVKYGLPAWQPNKNGGSWYASKVTLDAWFIEQCKKGAANMVAPVLK